MVECPWPRRSCAVLMRIYWSDPIQSLPFSHLRCPGKELGLEMTTGDSAVPSRSMTRFMPLFTVIGEPHSGWQLLNFLLRFVGDKE
jgi:hypothetical protein